MKTTKGVLIMLMAAVLCIGLTGTGIAAGGNGKGKGNVNGQSNGSGLRQTGNCVSSQLVPEEEMTVITGTVSDVSCLGQGISLDTGDQIYGIGPFRYWEEEEIARPSVGDYITVKGLNITFNDGTVKFIAFFVTITVEGVEMEIQLRDLETGLPLWRARGFGGGQRLQTGECPNL